MYRIYANSRPYSVSVTSGYYFTMMFTYADLLYSKDVQNLPERIPFPF
jgi:hypothetical protein